MCTTSASEDCVHPTEFQCFMCNGFKIVFFLIFHSLTLDIAVVSHSFYIGLQPVCIADEICTVDI